MGYYKKTIMLTNDNRDISVLDLVKTDQGVFGNFKNYTNITGDCLLGVCVDGKKVYKQNVFCNKSKGYDFKINTDIDLSSKIGCVLMRQDGNNFEPLVWGVNGDIVGYRSKILQNIQGNKSQKVENTYVSRPKECVDNSEHKIDNNSGITKQSAETINNTSQSSGQVPEKASPHTNYNAHIDAAVAYSTINPKSVDINEVGCRDCEDIKISQAALFESSEEDIQADIDQNIVGMEANFYEMISEQIDDLFANYPREENLENLVPNSKWVRVDYDNNGKEYVVGLIYDNQMLKYVAYGVPSVSRDTSPDGLEGYSQWLPLNPNAADDKGYYVMFQDANTGEGIKIN